VLSETLFGRLWCLRLVLGFILVGVSLGSRWWPVVLVAGLSLLLLAGEGHGSIGEGNVARLHLASQAIHLLAAGAWLGGFLPLALILAAPAINLVQTRSAVARFSTMGYFSVSLVLVTGVSNTELLSGGNYHVASAWTALLSVKLILVMTMLAVAISNWITLVPCLGSGSGDARRRLCRRVLVEALLGALVLGAASVLGTLPPPIS
jgi:copper resistance protein D